VNRNTLEQQSTGTDLVILGAGPAGCAAAISALQSGLSVAILETQPSSRLLPGETLHPGVEPIFKSLGVWEALLDCGFHRHRGIWREAEDGRRIFEPYGCDQAGPWLGFQVDRSRLDHILRTRVTDLGGKIEIIPRLDSLRYCDTKIRGVAADHRAFNAPFVIDGTGRHSWLAGKLNLTAERFDPKQRVRFGWAKEAMPELDGQPIFRQRRDGWDWRAPLGDGRTAWTELRHTSEKGGIDFSWRIFRECAGPGYFLLGDAANLMDPSAANGVLRALMSGIYAVHLIIKIQKGATSRQDAAIEYKRWIGEIFDLSLTVSRKTISPFPGSSPDLLSKPKGADAEKKN
jgi:2-polyprenyl-6-methoxyphenol hydroxylase-like FAD-dependent oxidoreductase